MPSIVTLAGKAFEPDLPKRLLSIAGEIREAGGRAFLVGGWVRDALLGKNCRDYDVEVYDLTQEQLLPILKRYGKTNLVGKAFGVIHLAMKGESLDFSFPRTESKVGYGHRGFVVHTDEKLNFKEAALRRDFTINAMGMELPDLTLCDPYHGIDDLKTKVLRHVGPAFVEDSLRILRGVQFASRFECTLAPETVELCRTLSLADLSVERLFEEFKKWLLKPGKPSFGLRAFLDIKLDGYFPEVCPFYGSWEGLGSLLNSVSGHQSVLRDDQKMIVAFAALLGGVIGSEKDIEEQSLRFLNRITNESKLLKGVPELLRCLSVLDFERVPSDSEMRRLGVSSQKFLGGLEPLCVLVESLPSVGEGFTMNENYAKEFRDAAARLGLLQKVPEPYLTGKKLMDMGLAPGKQMGDIIKQSFELQLDGKITDVEEAIAWARTRITSTGISR